jgi:uncharacterized membrane-anchored protein
MKYLKTAKVLVPAGVMVRELEGESVLLNINSETYFGLDEIGTRMWELLTTSESIQAVYDSLLAEYDVEPEKLYQDLEILIEKLVEHGLAEVVGE